MRIAHLVTAVFTAILTQGSIVSALPSDAFNKGDGYIGGKPTRDDIETRTVTVGDEPSVVNFDLEKRVTNIFPTFPISDNDSKWIVFLTSLGIIGYRGAKIVWKIIPSQWKQDTWDAIAKWWNAGVDAAGHPNQEVTADDVRLEAQRIGHGIHEGAEAVRPITGARV